MDISSSAEFAAEPDRVYAMMIDRDYLEQVCVASHSSAYDVSVTGAKTKTSRTLESPAAAAKFTGPHLTVIEEVTWGPAAGDGSRVGDMKLTVSGQPVALNGTMTISARGAGQHTSADGPAEGRDPAARTQARGVRRPGRARRVQDPPQGGADWLAG